MRMIALLLLTLPLLAQTPPSEEAASAAYGVKDYARCGDMYRTLARTSGNAMQTYNAACCFALAGNKDAAVEMLDKLIASGWANTRRLRTEPDFASLRDDPRFVAVLARSEENWKKEFGNDNRELWDLREGDQADRETPDVDKEAAVKRDAERLRRTKEIVASGALKTATDYFNAAMLHQHGSEPADLQEARRLALRASELDSQNKRARWLAAAAQDRYLWSIKKPQIYGTQFRIENGVWTLDPIDENAVSDEERAKWHVPPLAEAKKRADAMNRKKP